MKNTQRKLRIMWQSNAYWSPSGYSQQTASMYKSFRENGWTPENFAFIDMYGLAGGIMKDEFGFKHYPILDHMMGSDAMLMHPQHFKPDIIISLQDIWPLNPQDLQQIPNWIPWTPIDYDPIPKPLLNNLRFANRIISMSKFGEKKLQEQGFNSTYIPHGVDTNIFKPIDRITHRKKVGMNPDTFVFGMISANKESFNPRKSFQQVMEAFSMFLQHNQNSLLYIHTDPDFPGGWPLKQYAAELGIQNNLAFPDRYKQKFDTSKEDMNAIYNTFDCLLSPSSSEGFCIPVIEAQAAGVPVIVNNWTSMPELIEENKTGLIVKSKDKIYYPIGSYMSFPDEIDLFEKMMTMAQSNRKVMGELAATHAKKNYDQDMLFKTKWLPFLEKLEQERYPQK